MTQIHDCDMHVYRRHIRAVAKIEAKCKQLICIQDRVSPIDETGHASKPTSTRHILQLPAMDSF